MQKLCLNAKVHILKLKLNLKIKINNFIRDIHSCIMLDYRQILTSLGLKNVSFVTDIQAWHKCTSMIVPQQSQTPQKSKTVTFFNE